MIFTHTEFEVGKLKVDVNWNESVTPCKEVRFTLDGIEQIVDIKELYSLLMLFGDDHMQDNLIPVKTMEMVLIERLLHIKMKKDVKSGELVTFPYKYSVSRETYDELIKENPRQYRIVENLSTSTKSEDVQKKSE